jgi:RNA polymerase sigma-70 factor (ECF subfamily)
VKEMEAGTVSPERRAEAQESFQHLAKQELPRLYGAARQLAGDGAEDLVQETLLRAYRAFGTLRVPEAGGRWLQTIMANAFRDRLRKQNRSVDEVSVENVDDFSLYKTITDEDPFPYSDTLHLDFLGRFGREDVRQVLLRLPEIYRAPLVLRYVQGFATKEITRLMNVPLGTTLARLHRARKLFEREMWTYAEENGLIEEERTDDRQA